MRQKQFLIKTEKKAKNRVIVSDLNPGFFPAFEAVNPTIRWLLTDYARSNVLLVLECTQASYELKNLQTNLALTNSQHFKLFKPDFKNELIQKLLTCVAQGRQQKAGQLLQISPELMVEKVRFQDPSKRVFAAISAFEYALWALDTRYMTTMMLACVPHNQSGRNLIAVLQQQYNQLKTRGISYQLEGNVFTEPHFNCDPLLKKLHDYITKFPTDDQSTDSEERALFWCSQVGVAQRYLPIHILQHYCDPDTPFYPTPSFTATHLKRRHTFIYRISYNDSRKGDEDHIASTLELGRDYGYQRLVFPDEPSARRIPFCPETDLKALTALYKRRVKDLNLIQDSIKILYKALHTKNKECIIC